MPVAARVGQGDGRLFEPEGELVIPDERCVAIGPEIHAPAAPGDVVLPGGFVKRERAGGGSTPWHDTSPKV